MSTPTATGAESGGGGAVCPAVVIHGEPLTDRKSTFQAHAAQVKTTEQVSFQLSFLHAAGRLMVGALVFHFPPSVSPAICKNNIFSM